ncbi:MAG TPA: CPBP family intramembrane glutamic endopeptidase [Candidatus Acidoferrum sp.]|nr:CPBP family intramembrane glutamic endopeptidase [Candidatus Acidoferrum sp.]
MNDFDQPPQETPEAQPAPDAGLELAPVPPPPPSDPYAAFAPDLRVPWNAADLGVFLLIYLGINIVIGVIGLVGGAALFHKPFQTIQKDPVAFPLIAIVIQVLISAATILYFWILVRIRSNRPTAQQHEGFWRTMGWRPLGKTGRTPLSRVMYCLLGGVAMSLAVAEASNLLGKQPPTPIEDLFQTKSAIILLMFFGVLIAPLVEEMMFRGFLYPVVARRFGMFTGIITTGLLFGAFHTPQLWPAFGQIALLVGVGITLTTVRARARSVLASTLFHMAYNSTLFVGLLVQTKWLTDLSRIH